MKLGFVLVNIVCGVIINEFVFVFYFDFGYIVFVGFDVYENELVVYFGLLNNERVLLVLYMGIWMVEIEMKMEEWVFDNIRMVFVEGRLKSIVLE